MRRAEVLAGDAALESLTTAQDYDRRLGCCMMLCCLKAIDASERAGQYDYDNEKFAFFTEPTGSRASTHSRLASLAA